MIVHELLRHVDAAGVGKEGVDLFMGAVPVSAGDASLFVDQGGPRDGELPGLRWAKFQVFTRASDYGVAHAKALEIAEALTFRQRQVGGYWVYVCEPRHDPMPLGREDSQVYTFVINYDARWRQA